MKLRLIYTSILIFLCSWATGQTWENVGTPTLNRQPTSAGTQYRFVLGAGKGNWFPFPSALQGQTLKSSGDNTMVYGPREPLEYGQFIYTDAQLTRALAAGQATQLQIFNSFFRYSHGGSQVTPDLPQLNNLIPGQPIQTNSWAYDTVASQIKSTFNSGSSIGMVSADKFERYTHTATLGATGNDNDFIGLEIAFTQVGTVANNAYGLDPATYPHIDVTHPVIPNEHSLTLLRSRLGTSNTYIIAYDWQKLTQKIIVNGSVLSGLYNTSANWPGATVDVKVVRLGDTIMCYTSQFSDAPGGKGSLAFPLTVNLNSDTVLTKFKGKQSYGYVAQSQAGAFFGSIVFSGNSNNIYDLRNGNVYNYNGTGYVLNPAQSVTGLLGTRFFWRNITEHTYGYMPPTGLYDVIVEP